MDLANKHVVITQADRFMGPALVKGFNEAGAEVHADTRDLTKIGADQDLALKHPELDVLVVNLAHPRPDKLASELEEHDISPLFETLVYPLLRLGAAVLPGMIARGRGKILVMGSASPLRAFAKSSSYAAARAAQLAWVKSASVEVARHNVQINAIAQNFVENPEYYSEAYQQTDEFKERIKQVPAGRLGTAQEDVALALFLASNQCNFLTGAAIPFAGGWQA